MGAEDWAEREKRTAADVQAWLDRGDQLAARRANNAIEAVLLADRFSLAAIGPDVVDEIRQDVLTRLLDRDSGVLSGKERPIAYARRTWSNALKDRLRRWGRRKEIQPEALVWTRWSEEARAGGIDASRLLDAARVLAATAELTRIRRLAALLVTRPQSMEDDDWRWLVSRHGSPPERPSGPVDRDRAASLLYPAAEDPSRARDSFDKTLRRAIADLRDRFADVPTE